MHIIILIYYEKFSLESLHLIPDKFIDILKNVQFFYNFVVNFLLGQSTHLFYDKQTII